MARPTLNPLSLATPPPAGFWIGDSEVIIEQLASLVNEHAGALDALGAPINGTAEASTAAETITGGAATLGVLTTYLNSASGSPEYTLANGTFDGETKAFEEISGAVTGILTVATMDGPGGGANATFAFNTLGQRLVVQWRVALSAWHIIELIALGAMPVTVGTTVLTGCVMNREFALTLPNGVNHSVGTKGIPNGVRPGQRLHVAAIAVTGAPVCDISITARTKTTMANATNLANLVDQTWSLEAEWDGSRWQAIEFAAGTDVATLS